MRRWLAISTCNNRSISNAPGRNENKWRRGSGTLWGRQEADHGGMARSNASMTYLYAIQQTRNTGNLSPS